MMTSEAAPPQAGPGEEVQPWGGLHRSTVHRTSAPSNQALNAARWSLQGLQGGRQGGRQPIADAVILLALRRLTRDVASGDHDAELLAELRQIESGSYAQPLRAASPGS